jgi:hypothetical protein
MKKSLLLTLILFLTIRAFSQDVTEPCKAFDAFYKQKFLTGRLTKAETQQQFKQFTAGMSRALADAKTGYAERI